MTDRVLHHATSFLPADGAVHAGITRDYLRGNLLCAYENGGYNLDCMAVVDCSKANYISHTVTTSYSWVTGWRTLCLPVSPAMGGGWRSLTIEADWCITAPTTTGYLRCLLSPTPGPLEIDATGTPPGSTAVTLTTVAVVLTRGSATLAIPDAPTNLHLIGNLYTPVCYLHLAAKGDANGTIYIRALRVVEQ